MHVDEITGLRKSGWVKLLIYQSKG